MAEFYVGTEHVAHATMSNPTPVGWEYEGILYLVRDEITYATSGSILFNLPAGGSGVVDFSIIMPQDQGTFLVYLDVYVGSELLVGYQATESVTIVTLYETTLEGQVYLQGRPGPPDDSWVTELTVTFIEGGTVARIENVVTDDMGRFAISNVTPSTYDICVKSPHALSNLVAGVSIVAGEVTSVDFGILREGDVDNDDAVLAGDYSLLHAAFGSVPGDTNWDDRCDFNRNGAVDAGDYSLLHTNFGQVGDCWISPEPPPEELYSLEGGIWDAEIPFEAGSRYVFDLAFRNTSGQRYSCNLLLRFGGDSYSSGGTLSPNFSISLRNEWNMPSTGVHDMLLEVIIDDEFIGEFVVSTVEVV